MVSSSAMAGATSSGWLVGALVTRVSGAGRAGTRLAGGLSSGSEAARTRSALPPMTAATSSSPKPASSSASVIWTMPVASIGWGTAPSKSEPSPTCSIPATFVAWRIARAMAATSSAAAGGRPEPDADHAAGVGDPAQVRVGQVAGVVARSANAGVRRDHRAPGHRQDVIDRRRRGVGDVHDHAPGLHPLDHLAPGRRQSALGDAVRGAAEGVVEEVARRHHPEARVGNHLDVGRVAVERMRALDCQQSGGDRRPGPPPLQVCGEVRAASG